MNERVQKVYPRKQIVAWVQSVSRFKFQQVRNGVFLCLMIQKLYPNDTSKIKFIENPISDYDCTQNLRAVKKVLEKNEVFPNFNITQILCSKNNFEVVNWFRIQAEQRKIDVFEGVKDKLNQINNLGLKKTASRNGSNRRNSSFQYSHSPVPNNNLHKKQQQQYNLEFSNQLTLNIPNEYNISTLNIQNYGDDPCDYSDFRTPRQTNDTNCTMSSANVYQDAINSERKHNNQDLMSILYQAKSSRTCVQQSQPYSAYMIGPVNRNKQKRINNNRTNPSLLNGLTSNKKSSHSEYDSLNKQLMTTTNTAKSYTKHKTKELSNAKSYNKLNKYNIVVRVQQPLTSDPKSIDKNNNIKKRISPIAVIRKSIISTLNQSSDINTPQLTHLQSDNFITDSLHSISNDYQTEMHQQALRQNIQQMYSILQQIKTVIPFVDTSLQQYKQQIKAKFKINSQQFTFP